MGVLRCALHPVTLFCHYFHICVKQNTNAESIFNFYSISSNPKIPFSNKISLKDTAVVDNQLLKLASRFLIRGSS